MGAVYKGFQTSLERYVAIKILPPSFDEDQQYAQRFKQEAKTMGIAARVSTPSIREALEKTGLQVTEKDDLKAAVENKTSAAAVARF